MDRNIFYKSYPKDFMTDIGNYVVGLNWVLQCMHQQQVLLIWDIVYVLKRGFCLRQSLANAGNNGHPPPSSLYVIETTRQVSGIHTFIR